MTIIRNSFFTTTEPRRWRSYADVVKHQLRLHQHEILRRKNRNHYELQPADFQNQMKSRLRRKDNLERQNKKLPMNFYSLWNIKNIASIINNAVILLRKTLTTTAALNLEFFLMQDTKNWCQEKGKTSRDMNFWEWQILRPPVIDHCNHSATYFFRFF